MIRFDLDTKHVLASKVKCRKGGSSRLAINGFGLGEVGDFGAQNCLPALNLIRSTIVYLTTEPPIS